MQLEIATHLYFPVSVSGIVQPFFLNAWSGEFRVYNRIYARFHCLIYQAGVRPWNRVFIPV